MTGFGTSLGETADAVERVRVLALYDRATGAIAFQRTITVLGDAEAPRDDELIAEAKAWAAERRAESAALAIALSDEPGHAHGAFRIDVQSGTFVPLEPDEPRDRERGTY